MGNAKLRIGAMTVAGLCALSLSACAGPSDGVWWVELDLAEDQSCSQFVAHNFVDASVPEEEDDEDPWSRLEEDAVSPAGFFALVTQDAEGLIWTAGGQVLRGEQTKEGWRLEGEHFETVSRSDSHPDGYAFSSRVENTAVNTLELTHERDTLSGTWTSVTTSTADYTESDDWSPELAQFSQTPVGAYLFLEDGTPASNAFDFEDCSSAPCAMSAETTCSASASMLAVRTELDPQDFEGVSDAGFDAGL